MNVFNNNIFLDDVRVPRDCLGYMYPRIGDMIKIYERYEWNIVRNFEQFKIIIEAFKGRNVEINMISFDHDLADFHYELTDEEYNNFSDEEKMNKFGSLEKDGFDCAKWLVEYYKEHSLKLPKYVVHSMNPIGSERIKNLFKDARTSH